MLVIVMILLSLLTLISLISLAMSGIVSREEEAGILPDQPEKV